MNIDNAKIKMTMAMEDEKKANPTDSFLSILDFRLFLVISHCSR